MKQNMDPHKDGLYNKYYVERTDKSPRHTDCDYFVLDLTHDPYARLAIAAYALNCQDDYPALAKDLRDKIRRIEESRILDFKENFDNIQSATADNLFPPEIADQLRLFDA